MKIESPLILAQPSKGPRSKTPYRNLRQDSASLRAFDVASKKRSSTWRRRVRSCSAAHTVLLVVVDRKKARDSASCVLIELLHEALWRACS